MHMKITVMLLRHISDLIFFLLDCHMKMSNLCVKLSFIFLIAVM